MHKIIAILLALAAALLLVFHFMPRTPPDDPLAADGAARLLDGIFTGKTAEALDAEGIGADFHMHFMDFLEIDGEIWAYYIKGNADGKMATGLAKSTDGLDFVDCGLVLEPTPGGWDNEMTSFAGVWHEDGVFYLTYEGSGREPAQCNGAIGLATSTDGLHFEKQGRILHYTGRGLEAGNIGTPDLYKEGDTWYLFYHSFNWNTCQICVASGPDLFHLTRAKRNPIIPARKCKFDAGTTGRRDIVRAGGYYYMVYEVSTAQPYETASWGHTFARSKDLLRWEIADKLLYPATGGGMGNDGPNWYIDGDDVFVYFRADGNTSARTKLIFAQ